MKKSSPQPNGRGDRRRSPIAYLTQDETKRLFSAIKSKRDRAIFPTSSPAAAAPATSPPPQVYLPRRRRI